eukprot:TRINITY_DN12562_c0_g1_i1.p1 TRINITY_DN12562_c0_g1~~TRINITY_DN12562_c0_g1_i1.p1  ORF type:complete len:888 (+),score=126.11 TRINITY_DN12562_c0_g1_i1:116-2779(+)
MATLEIWPQGARLTKIFLALSSRQSPFAQVFIDGELVGCTQPHINGDKNPRWDDRIRVDARGHFLTFKVLVEGVIGGYKFCGEGSVDLQVVTRRHENPCTVALSKGDESTGFLQFAFSELPQGQMHGVVDRNPRCAYGGYEGGGGTDTAALQQQQQQRERTQHVALPEQQLQQQTVHQELHRHHQNYALEQQGGHWTRGASRQENLPTSAALPISAPPLFDQPAPNPLASPVASGAAGPGADSNSGRLGITAIGKQRIAELMQSKDRLRQLALRPFMQGVGPGNGVAEQKHLPYAEFCTAIRQVLQELELTIPGEGQMQQMFSKHSSGQPGVGREEYEALLFRLLCFLLASGEVDVTSAPRVAPACEERDKHWREEFLKKNQRKFCDVYDVGKKLGEGTFGAVFEATLCAERALGPRRRTRVAKVIDKSKADSVGTSHARVREEFAVLKRLDHPNVARIFEDFEDDRSFYLIMEPCRGGDLEEAVKNPRTRDPTLWERFVATVMQHTLSAIAYCHSKGIIHKDLKPENIMMSSPREAPIDDTHVVVVDFGLAEMFANPADRGTLVAGTPPFMAPEVWAGNFSRSCDIWSCGVVLFHMLSGQYPFLATTLEAFPRVVASEPDWRLIGGASAEAQLICWYMLCKKEESRPSASVLLGDRWFGVHGLLTSPSCNGAAAAAAAVAAPELLRAGKRSHFEKFVSRLVATQLDAGQMKRVNEAFRAFDRDKDGSLTREELERGLVMLGANPQEAAQAAAELDVGTTGRISYTEFLAGVTDIRGRSAEERDNLLWLAWQQFAPDSRGYVSTCAIQDALAARGMTVAEMPKAFLQQLRRGSSGTMSFQDFKDLFRMDESCSIMSSFVGGINGTHGGVGGGGRGRGGVQPTRMHGP